MNNEVIPLKATLVIFVTADLNESLGGFMLHHLRTLCGLLLVTLALGCNTHEPTSTVTLDFTSLYGRSPLSSNRIDQVTVTVTAADLATPIVLTPGVNDGTVTANIAPGPARIFTIDAVRTDVTPPVTTYWGQVQADLPSGASVNLALPAYAAGMLSGTVTTTDGTQPPNNVTITATAQSPRANVAAQFNMAVQNGQFTQPLPTGIYALTASVKIGNTQYALSQALLVNIEQGSIALTTVTLSANPTGYHLQFYTQPRDHAAGATLGTPVTVGGVTSKTDVIVVATYDSAGDLVPTATGEITIALAANSIGATLAGTASAKTLLGVAEFSNLNINAVGAGYQLTATSSSGAAGAVSQPFSITAGSATQLLLVSTPVSPVVQIPFTVAVTALDKFGNIANGYTGRVALSCDDSTAALPSAITLNAGVGIFANVVLSTSGTHTLTAVDTAQPTLTGSLTLATQSGGAAALTLTALPDSVSADVAATVVVSAVDAQGNIETGYTGTVAFSATDAAAALPKPYTFTASDAGSHQFTFGLHTVGPQIVHVTDTANAALTVASPNLLVTQGAARVFVISNAPSSVAAGTTFQIGVVVQDAYGNLATHYKGTPAVVSSDPIATLPAAVAFTGAHSTTNANITLFTAGLQQITVVDAGAVTVSGSTPVQVSPGNPNGIAIQGSTVPGVGDPTDYVVSGVDRYGNVAPNYVGTVHVSSTDTAATLPSNYTFTAADHGTHRFVGGVTFMTLGPQTLTIGDGTHAAYLPLVASPGIPASLTVRSLPSNTSACTVFGAVVQLHDQFNNLAVNANQAVIASVASPAGRVINGNTHMAPTAGVATFTDLMLPQNGNFLLTFNYGAAAYSLPILVVAAPPPTVSHVGLVSSDANGMSRVQYTVQHACGAPVDMLMQYVTGNGNNMMTQGPSLPGTVGVQGVPSSASGLAQVFVWNSLSDCGFSPTVAVELLLTPSVDGVAGTAGDVTVQLSAPQALGAATATIATPHAWDATVAGDINRDGMLDLLGINTTSGRADLLLGDANGLMTASPSFANVTLPGITAVALADLNRDGLLDVVFANPTSGSSTIAAYLQTSAGVLSALPSAQLSVAATTGLAIGVSDFNADGKADIVVAVNANTNNAGIFAGRGDGTFAAYAALPDAGPFPTALTVADLNMDGAMDLVATNTQAGTVTWITFTQGVADTSFASYHVGDMPGAVAVGDLNLDGAPDLVVLNGNNNVTTLLSDGPSSTNAPTTSVAAVDPDPSAVALADIDGDGLLDAVITSRGANSVSVHINAGYDTYINAVVSTHATEAQPVALVLTDFTRDGLPDAWVVSQGGVAVQALPNTTPHTTQPVLQAALTQPAGAGAAITRVGDINNDGRPDVIVVNVDANSLSVYTGIGDGSLSAPTFIALGAGPTDVALGDLNNDGALDILVTVGSGDVGLLTNVGDGTFGKYATLVPAAQATAVSVGDVDADGNLDVVVVANPNVLSIYPGEGDGTLHAPNNLQIDVGPTRVLVADANADGLLDVIALSGVGDANGIVRVFYNAAGSFTATQSVTCIMDSGTDAIAVADLNNDTFPDLIAANLNAGTVTSCLGAANGKFAAAQEASTRGGVTAPTALAVANLGGLSTAFVTNADGGLAILPGSGDGTFSFSSGASVGVAPRGLAMADLNADGWLDLVTTGSSSADVSVSLSMLGGNSVIGASSFSSNTGSAAQSLTIGDINHDGWPDMVFAAPGDNALVAMVNQGGPQLFTGGQPYFPSAPPTQVRLADMDGDGYADLVAATANGFTVLLNQADGFGTPQDYLVGSGVIALAVGDLNGDGHNDVLAITESTIQFVAGPAFAGGNVIMNNSGARDVVLADFNRDGALDFAAVEVSGSIAFGAGHNNGTFTTATLATSGCAAAQSIAAADLDHNGTIDLALSCNASNVVLTVLTSGTGQIPVFTSASTVPVMAPTQVALADVNRDGNIDWVASSGTDGVTVGLNNGIGGLLRAFSLITGPGGNSVAVADLNHDGFVEIATPLSNIAAVALILGGPHHLPL